MKWRVWENWVHGLRENVDFPPRGKIYHKPFFGLKRCYGPPLGALQWYWSFGPISKPAPTLSTIFAVCPLNQLLGSGCPQLPCHPCREGKHNTKFATQGAHANGATKLSSKIGLSGTEKGVIKKGAFSQEKSLKSLNSLESLEDGQRLLCFPHSQGSLESLEIPNSPELLENGLFWKDPFSKRPLFPIPSLRSELDNGGAKTYRAISGWGQTIL